MYIELDLPIYQLKTDLHITKDHEKKQPKQAQHWSLWVWAHTVPKTALQYALLPCILLFFLLMRRVNYKNPWGFLIDLVNYVDWMDCEHLNILSAQDALEQHIIMVVGGINLWGISVGIT